MSQENLIGQTIAGWRLLAHVGEGGTALVYRAEHPDKGKAAIKVLRGKQAQDPVAVKRFLKEGEFGVRAAHPNIIRTLDFGSEEGLYWLALEWAEGEPLASFLGAPDACCRTRRIFKNSFRELFLSRLKNREC